MVCWCVGVFSILLLKRAMVPLWRGKVFVLKHTSIIVCFLFTPQGSRRSFSLCSFESSKHAHFAAILKTGKRDIWSFNKLFVRIVRRKETKKESQLSDISTRPKWDGKVEEANSTHRSSTRSSIVLEIRLFDGQWHPSFRQSHRKRTTTKCWTKFINIHPSRRMV